MDSKAKHRILGLLVVAGLIVILLPFIESGKQMASDATLVKAPPFPDQSMQVSVTPPVAAPTPAPATTPASTPPANTDDQSATGSTVQKRATAMIAPEVTAKKAVLITPADQPDDTIHNAHDHTTTVAPAIQNPLVTPDVPVKPVVTPQAMHVKPQTKIEDISPQEIDNRISHSVSAEATPKTKKSMAMAKRVNSKLHRAAIATKGPIDNNGLLKLKGSAWVIQIGSYKNKASALRLVNQLRAKGYRAFIQQLSSESGESTRVFIGPEGQQASARALVRELETEMHVRGIVISYTPLEL